MEAESVESSFFRYLGLKGTNLNGDNRVKGEGWFFFFKQMRGLDHVCKKGSNQWLERMKIREEGGMNDCRSNLLVNREGV